MFINWEEFVENLGADKGTALNQLELNQHLKLDEIEFPSFK
jgi:hypothetical protein